MFWLIDRSKTDIVQYFGDGAELGLQLCYAPTRASPSVVHTLDGARGFLRDAHVLFGFPDIVFEPAHALRSLRERLLRSGADVVLGAVPAPAEQVGDRVLLDERGRALEVRIKPSGSSWPHIWMLAAWAPPFTSFLHGWLAAHLSLWPRVLFSSALFALGHFDNVGVVASSFILGLVCALAFERSRSLWLPVILHAVNNSVALIFLYLAAALSARFGAF